MTEASIEQQATLVVKNVSDRLKKAGPRVVNRAARELQALAIAESKKNSRRIYQAIAVEKARDGSFPARARVFINTAHPHGARAAITHNNTAGYHITPKVAGIKFLWIPLTSAGRRHELHQHDSIEKGLKGNIPSTGRAVGDWSDYESNPNRPLDFILLPSVDIPPAKAPLFLTGVAQRNRTALVAFMRQELDASLKEAK